MRNSYKTYPITLKIDCRNLAKSAIDELEEKLVRWLDVQILGEDIIFADGDVTEFAYNRIWEILDHYNVIID